MRLNNNQKIISEDDIMLSDGSQQALSDRLQSLQKEIDSLKSNVKWIYKYGGVGSGTGGGGTTQQTFSIYAELDNIQLKDQTIVLDETKESYSLRIRINNPNGMAFNVQYTYSTTSSSGSDVTQSRTQILDINNNYTFETTLVLNNNSTLSITATDGNNTKQVMCNYITKPYIFNLSLVDNDGDPLSGEIFVATAKESGINVKLDYNISITASVKYSYVFNNGEAITGEITDKNNSILFPIDSELFKEENAGFYSASFVAEVLPEGQELITVNRDTSFSLIPEQLYVLLTPESGIIYPTETEDPYLYLPGYIAFNYRVYEGQNNQRTYQVSAYLNDPSIENPESSRVLDMSITERDQEQFKVYTTKEINTLTIKAVRGSVTYTKTYYIYTQGSSSSLDWFEDPADWTQYYYRIEEVTPNFAQYLNRSYIEQNVNSEAIKITNIVPPNVSGNGLINTHIAIGLQYNTINNDNSTIINFYNRNTGDQPILTIKQEQIERAGSQYNYYIKKESNAKGDSQNQYHLLQIYSQCVKQIGQNDFYYEYSFYIDGILESTMGSLVNAPLLVSDFEVLPVNCFINLLEVDFKPTQLVENQDTGIMESQDNGDVDVYRYFLKYQNKIKGIDVSEDSALLQYLPNFKIGLNGRVTTDFATINNIAGLVSVPTLLATYTEQDSGQAMIDRIEQDYGEDGSGPGSDLSFQVTLQYGNGKKALQQIKFPDGFQNAQFRLSLQGSSTKLYRVKNFNLAIENTSGSEEQDVYLYSPNFANGDSTTFLPETEFTLKADVVDSSHSNNTSCGKFINTVCRKFSTDIEENGYYKDYIKNCLEGFPFLMFLQIISQDPVTQSQVSTYYYFGVYNFNLGRSSYYNLGYKDLSVFGDNTTHNLTDAANSDSGFTFYSISPSQNILREGLGVAEIQGGSNYFDFSQYDPTILFQQDMGGGGVDTAYMFGDLVWGSNQTEEGLQNLIVKFVQQVSRSGGYLFGYLKKRFGSYDNGYTAERMVDGQYTGESLNQVPNYRQQYKKVLKSGAWTYEPNGGLISAGTDTDLQQLIVPDPNSNRLAALNFQSASEYYTICMTLGLVDSVMKNLNIKTWNGTTWYPAFYDMDTCLGINNQGNPINYFAFSDYWHSQSNAVEDMENTVKPTNCKIYRDFSPARLGENGFDVPTNYLFTVAKYSRFVIGPEADGTETEQSYYTTSYPQEIYAKWRANTVNQSTHAGILRNADAFMDNFFANNLAQINPVLVSYNYRSKYLGLDNSDENSITWRTTDFNKFNGTRVNKVRDWLEGRLHILDVYFGLNKDFTSPVEYLETEENGDPKVDESGNLVWSQIYTGQDQTGALSDLSYTSNWDVSSNPDVVILGDIFGTGVGTQVSGEVQFSIRCPENSPLQIYNPTSTIRYNYILGGDQNQLIDFTTTGVQNVKMGGSQAWTYLSSIDWLSGGNVTFNTDKLENISGSSGSFSNITLNTPNIKTISLNSPNYTGSLSLDGSENYPNINSINISNSKLSLTLNNINVVSVNVSNINNSGSSINITNCPNITTFSCAGSRLQTLRFTGIKGNLKNMTIDNTNIGTINLGCSDSSGSSILISNDSTVSNIILSGFEKVTITNCPKLRSVQIQDTTKTLTITNCTNESIAISVNGDASAGQVKLTNLTTLQNLDLQGTVGINRMYLPTGVTLVQNACYNLTNLLSINGGNIQIGGRGVFRNCQKYALKNDVGDYTDLRVKSSVTDLSELFYQSTPSDKITITDVKHFMSASVPDSNSVTNITNLFRNNYGIKYELKDLKSDLTTGSSNFIDLTKFNKVTNATGAFSSTQIVAWNKNMWNFGGASLNLSYFCEPMQAAQYNDTVTGTIYLTIDLLTYVISKVTYLFSTSLNSRLRYIFVNESGEIIPESEEIKLKDFFNPGGVAPSKLVSLSRFYLHPNQVVDLSDTFTASWSSLTSLTEFLWVSGQKYKGVDHLLYYLPKITTLSNVLTASTLEERTDLYTVLNWQAFLNRNGSFAGCSSDSYAGGSFTLNKTISASDYNSLCNMIMKSNITDISFLFYNCNIIGYQGDFTFGTTYTSNTKIKYTRGLYRNCKILTTEESTENNGMAITNMLFTQLAGVTDVQYMFYNCKLINPLTFNFFNKRRRDPGTNTNVYVKIDSEYQPAELFIYSYKQEITSFRSIFQQVEWGSGCLQYNPEDNSSLIQKNKVLYNDEEYETYYTRTTIPPVDEESEPTYVYNEQHITQGYEITDAENLTGKGYYLQMVSTGSEQNWNNPTLGEGVEVDRLICPPDLFYGAASSMPTDQGGYSYALAGKNSLTGLIPEHLFSKNKTGSVSGVFQNCTIIPKFYHTHEEEGQTVNVYVCYPDNYTSNTVLDRAFNSNIVVPMNDINDNHSTINWVFIITEKTIPSTVSSMDYAFDNQNLPNYWTGQLKEQDLNYINFIGKIDSDQITSGFDLTKFNQLRLDYLYYSQIPAIGSGNLFHSSYDAKNMQFADSTGASRVVKISSDNSNAYSRYIMFPSASGPINRLVQKHISGVIYLKRSQIINSTQSEQYYRSAGFTIQD